MIRARIHRNRSARALVALVALQGCAHDLSFLDRDGAVADVADATSAEDAADSGLMCPSPANGLACDPVANCNCASGQSCAAPDLDQNRARCVVPGALGERASCAGPRECAAGTSCVFFSCRRSCRSRADCRADEHCITQDPTLRIGVCAASSECTPRTSDGCPSDSLCKVENAERVGESGTVGVAWCEEPAGSAGEGANCEMDSCTRDLDCRSRGLQSRCVRRCTANEQCTGAGRGRCDLTSAPVVVGSTTWGECAP
ncbi:MAG: hypothetical protein JNK05_04470 [Myxococcales bacterium]|nr:hypothetical protein [Myxococcales bacterium]